jgi:hypothetical protein
MTAIYRAPSDYLFGTLSTAAAVSDTSLSATLFTGLAGGAYSTGYVLPLVLHDPSVPIHEVVWVTAHTAGSSTVTVIRGKELTSAQAWPAGTQIVCAPTAVRDMLGAMGSSVLPSDGHVGYRTVQTDTGTVVQQTYAQGYLPDVGVAKPGDIGPDIGSNLPPTWANIIMRSGRFTANSDANGRWTVSFRTPFPNATMNVVIQPIGTFWTPVTLWSQTASGFVAQGYADLSGTVVTSGKQLGAHYIATGY